MNKLNRLLNELRQELDKEMEGAYIVYRRKDLMLVRQYFKRLALEYDHEPVLSASYNASKIMLGDLIFRPEHIEYFCKCELEDQEKEKEEE